MNKPNKVIGLEVPGDEKVPVPVRDWDAMKRAIWRSKEGWDRTLRETTELLARCAHMEGCAGKTDETAPCLIDCPDREMRLSVLVILNTARQLGPLDARKAADSPYFAPSREYFSDVIAQLAAAQAELEALRSRLGSTETEPVHTLDPPNKEMTP